MGHNFLTYLTQLLNAVRLFFSILTLLSINKKLFLRVKKDLRRRLFGSTWWMWNNSWPDVPIIIYWHQRMLVNILIIKNFSKFNLIQANQRCNSTTYFDISLSIPKCSKKKILTFKIWTFFKLKNNLSKQKAERSTMFRYC